MIDNFIIESFLECKFKAFKKSKNKIGSKTDFELLQNELYALYKIKFFEKLKSKIAKSQIKHNFDNNSQSVNMVYIFESKFQYNQLITTIDLTETIQEQINSKKIEYVPCLILWNEKVTNFHKFLICIKAILLSEKTNIPISFCKIVYGKSLRITKIKLINYYKDCKKLLRELTNLLNSEVPPIIFRKSHCNICEFKESCLSELSEKDDLSLLGRMSQKEIIKQNNKGIFTVNQFSYTFRPRKRTKNKDKPIPHNYALKALAIREKQTYIYEVPKLPNVKTEIYFDFESLPEESFIYLIGIVIIDGENISQKSLWANSINDEMEIFRQLFRIVSEYKNYAIFHYGSYEIQTLKRFNKKSNGKYETAINDIIEKSVNVLSFFHSKVYTPTYTNKLKDIAKFLHFKWTDTKASGIQSIVWRKKWELFEDNVFKNKIIKYNIEDCYALKLVKDWLLSFEVKYNINDNKSFAKVEDIKIPDRFSYNFQVFKSELPDLETINKSAYFDYQRNKIYFKTDKSVKKSNKRENKNQYGTNRINKFIEIERPEKCIYCNHNQLHQWHKKSKIIIDLKFTYNGIKRWIYCYKVRSFRCANCDRIFTPDYIKKISSKYGHNLAAWSVDLFISRRIHLNTIKMILRDSFKINIPISSLDNIKSEFSKKHMVTFEEIKKTVLRGELIHIDETTIKVTGFTSPYVWVLTNMNTVFYLFRPNREADFLMELLKDFKGVLVSDFYPGYESLPCQQQKCLVHLIRDMNEDLFKNQFNKEYIELVQEFGKLLITIVDAIKKYGLKKRHLKKYKTDVEIFYNKILNQEYETDLSISYQKRFKKNKGKLFNFLNFDNVPWNNNNAEHAIIPFAKYRTIRCSHFSKNTLTEYLILLSIQQTCKYRGISFLEFLKSKELSIEEYTKNN